MAIPAFLLLKIMWLLHPFVLLKESFLIVFFPNIFAAGDQRLEISLAEIGGKGLFTRELDVALASKEAPSSPRMDGMNPKHATYGPYGSLYTIFGAIHGPFDP